ncbi:MAG: MXAN_5187 C-terminal domain-containing protein [Acidobacteriota bacterium]
MTWERDLQALERAIAAVSVEYDAFLYGTGARPPVESRRNVERMMRSLGGRDADSAADRYRFSTLQGRWNALGERWERLQAEKEAGRRPGLYGHFRPAHDPEGSPAPGPAAPDQANAERPASVRRDEAPAPVRERDLYEKFVAAKVARGEPAAGLDFERFADNLRKETERLRERFGGADVEFDVAERDGKVKLVARRKS